MVQERVNDEKLRLKIICQERDNRDPNRVLEALAIGMSETSRSWVTITLGRTGQVVKRDGSSYDGAYINALPHAGNKRSVRERLGNCVDSSAQFSNKRMRGDGGAMIDADDIRLSRDDLRHKIIRKNMRKQSHNRLQDGEDLRNILSRPAQSSTNSVSAWEKLSETNDTRPRYLEPKDRRHHIPTSRDDRQLISLSRSSSQHLPSSKVQLLLNPRVQHVPDARESGRIRLEPKDSKYCMPELSRSSMISDVHGPRITNNVSKMEPGINSSSPSTLDHLRRRSPPDEALMSSRGLPAPVRDEEPNRIYAVRTLGDTRSSALKDAFDFSRPTSSSSYLTEMAPPVGLMKTRAPIVSTHPLPSSHAQNTSYVVDDHSTVDIFLRSLGLEKFALPFKAEEVDMYSLKRMTDSDLKELGIPMGPRKKIMLALQPRLRRQAL
ncbi:uncharacterized protein LOC142533224 [Primulina tabacum]|uniref:uncharacterized protein LOC142533224 n=1 Tax=Primulina tabacum TaxID=48773 RepID=UPI003F5AA16D